MSKSNKLFSKGEIILGLIFSYISASLTAYVAVDPELTWVSFVSPFITYSLFYSLVHEGETFFTEKFFKFLAPYFLFHALFYIIMFRVFMPYASEINSMYYGNL